MGVLSWWAWLCVARQAHQQAGHKWAGMRLVVHCTPGKQAGHKLVSVGLVVRCTPGKQAGHKLASESTSRCFNIARPT